MSNLILVDRLYEDDNALECVIAYCLNVNRYHLDKFNNNIEYYCFGVNQLSPKHIIDSMVAIKRIYHKEDGKQLHHIVLGIYQSFDFGVEHRKKWASLIAWDIGYYIYEKGYQNIVAIHIRYDGYVHFHIILNSVNYAIGKKLTNLKEFVNDINQFLKSNYQNLKWNNIYFNRENI